MTKIDVSKTPYWDDETSTGTDTDSASSSCSLKEQPQRIEEITMADRHPDDDSQTVSFWKGKCAVLKELLSEKEVSLNLRDLEIVDLKSKIDEMAGLKQLLKDLTEEREKLESDLHQTKAELDQSKVECEGFKSSWEDFQTKYDKMKKDLDKANKHREECHKVAETQSTSCLQEVADGASDPEFAEGDIVKVQFRQSSGVNKSGKVARIVKINADKSYKVRYFLDGREDNLGAILLSSIDDPEKHKPSGKEGIKSKSECESCDVIVNDSTLADDKLMNQLKKSKVGWGKLTNSKQTQLLTGKVKKLEDTLASFQMEASNAPYAWKSSGSITSFPTNSIDVLNDVEMTTGTHVWKLRFHQPFYQNKEQQMNSCIRVGVVSSLSHLQFAPLGDVKGTWSLSVCGWDRGETWTGGKNTGQHELGRCAREFGIRSMVITFTLDLIRDGTLCASIDNRRPFLLFSDMKRTNLCCSTTFYPAVYLRSESGYVDFLGFE